MQEQMVDPQNQKQSNEYRVSLALQNSNLIQPGRFAMSQSPTSIAIVRTNFRSKQ